MIYFDNASTSFPKAPGVSDCVKNFIDTSCFNINRGSYNLALKATGIVYETREIIADFFGASNPKNVIFTSGTTQSVNIALNGLLNKGDKVISSSMEHNAVYRPLENLRLKGVDTEYITFVSDTKKYLENFETAVKNIKPKLVITTHASNVCGAIMPINELGRICKENNVIFVVDAAQTSGVLDIDVKRDNIDILCFSGHKGLLSLPGVGACVVTKNIAEILKPFIFGGTGSFSHSAEMPSLLPDKFEAGTANLVGIAAMQASINYIKNIGMNTIFNKEKELQSYFEEKIKFISGVKIVGSNYKNRCPVSALTFDNIDNAEVAYRLDDEYGIMVRSGLQCAPLAHKTLGTFPEGVVRFSFGHMNTIEETDIAVNAIKNL